MKEFNSEEEYYYFKTIFTRQCIEIKFFFFSVAHSPNSRRSEKQKVAHNFYVALQLFQEKGFNILFSVRK